MFLLTICRNPVRTDTSDVLVMVLRRLSLNFYTYSWKGTVNGGELCAALFGTSPFNKKLDNSNVNAVCLAC